MTMQLTKEQLLEKIKLEGINNIIFNVPMSPIPFSPNADVVVPCKINIEEYNPFKSDKITMVSMIKGFSRADFFLNDFVSNINNGTFAIRGYVLP